MWPLCGPFSATAEGFTIMPRVFGPAFYRVFLGINFFGIFFYEKIINQISKK